MNGQHKVMSKLKGKVKACSKTHLSFESYLTSEIFGMATHHFYVDKLLHWRVLW